MDIDMPYWLDLIIYLVTGTTGAAGLAAGVKWLRNWIKMRAFLRGVREIHQTYSTLLAVQTESGAKRALIMKSENGGGIPRPGHKLHSTIVYETYSAPLESIKEAWDRRELDRWYIKMLNELITNNQIDIKIDEIDEKEQLKDSYIIEGVIKSKVVSLGIRSNAYWYLFLSYTEDVEFKSQHREAIRTAESLLVNLLGLSPVSAK